MTEYTYRIERDFTPEVNRIAAQIQHKVDQAALDKAADTLAEFGYVKVVRCRDCTNYATDELGDYCTLLDFEDVKSIANGFCAWGERREGAES